MTDARLAALRALLDERGLDAILLSRSANKRYYSGFRLSDAEEPTSGWSGTLLVTRDANLILADSRYTEQATIEAPGWRAGPDDRRRSHEDLPPLLLEHEVESLGMEAAVVPHAGGRRWPRPRPASSCTRWTRSSCRSASTSPPTRSTRSAAPAP